MSQIMSVPMGRRPFLIGAGAALSAAALSACGVKDNGGGSSSSAGSSSGGSSGGVTEITVWYWDTPMQAIVDGFNASQSAIKATFQQLSWDDCHLKIITSFASGTGAPDVAVLDFEYLGAFAVPGGMIDLSAAPYNGGQFEKDMVPYKWTQCKASDGRLFAFPWDVAPSGVWYRADLFEAAGIESDPDKLAAQIKTNDDLFALGEQLKAKTPETALFADVYNDIFWPAVLQQGQTWFDASGKVNIAKKCGPALALAANAHKQGLGADITWWTDDWNAGVSKNAFAAMNVACWEQSLLLSTNPDTAGKWRVIRAPGGDYSWGGGFYAIPASTKKADAAWEFIKYAGATVAGQNAAMKNNGIFPAYMPAWQDPLYDAGVDFFGGQKVYKLWEQVAQDAPGYPVHAGYIEAKDIIEAAVTDFQQAGGTGDPQKAMDDAEAKVKSQVEGYS